MCDFFFKQLEALSGDMRLMECVKKREENRTKNVLNLSSLCLRTLLPWWWGFKYSTFPKSINLKLPSMIHKSPRYIWETYILDHIAQKQSVSQMLRWQLVGLKLTFTEIFSHPIPDCTLSITLLLWKSWQNRKDSQENICIPPLNLWHSMKTTCLLCII